MARYGKDKSKGEKVKVSKESYQKARGIFQYFRPYRGVFFIGFIFLALSSVTGMAFPLLMGKLFGASSPQDGESFKLLDFDNINSVVALLFVIFAAQSVFSFFRIYLFSIVTENTLTDIRKSAYQQLITSPISFFNRNKVGELTSRVATDINLLKETFNTTIAEFIRQIITITIGITFLVIYSPKLALIMLGVIVVMVVIGFTFGRFIRKLSKEAQDSAADSNSILEETLTAIVNVKAFANELFEVRRYDKAVQEIKRLSIKGAIWKGVFVSFIIFSIFGSIVFVIWQGLLLAESGAIAYDDFMSFIFLTIFVGASIGSLPELYANLQKAVGATENLMKILEEETEDIVLEDKVSTVQLQGEVCFKNVHFEYESRKEVPVLKGVDFAVRQGEQIAIVGPSGAGKSTIASLLLRFYEPTGGTLLFDNKPANEYGLSELRNNMALVPQEVILFGGSIKENIAYGNPEATDEEIIAAAVKANAEEFIEKFPEKYDTIVGDRGIQLSGGQRQRIAIARAVLKDPRILILDEATSSLDSESEKLVQDALEQLMKGRTSFVIAHRLSTIKNADKILVLDHGELKETGTHHELVDKEGGIYKHLSLLQTDIS
jgi:ABC-type multidrug transport system fused ATPase/permease subunit